KHYTLPLLGMVILQICCTKTDDLHQSCPALSIQQGDQSFFCCNFPETLMSSVTWIRQKNGRHTFHLFLYPSGKRQNRRLKASTLKKERKFSLYLFSAEITDTAQHLCLAYSAQGLSFGRASVLKFTLKLKNGDPVVYLLLGPWSNTLSSCLYTDFTLNSQEDRTKSVFHIARKLFSSNKSVLNRGMFGGKRNGMTGWWRSKDFEQISTFEQEFYPNSKVSCMGKLVRRRFGTDYALNTDLSKKGFSLLGLLMSSFQIMVTLRATNQ
uniref:T-cell receptor alpha chain constant domain-containing protein n=1 Tax=Sus scrofa TaxID=9823 RepID=A0A4X1V199_PIG